MLISSLFLYFSGRSLDSFEGLLVLEGSLDVLLAEAADDEDDFDSDDFSLSVLTIPC